MSHTSFATTAPAASNYGFHCLLPKQDFTQAVAKVTEALRTEGFGILSDIDVSAITFTRHAASSKA